MAVKRYEKRIPVNAIQFEGMTGDPNHINEVMGFVQVPVSIDFTVRGIELRVILNPLNVLVVPIGDYIVKEADGKLTQHKKASFEAEYTEVTE